MRKEPKLNEVFEFEGIQIKCVEDADGDCDGCKFDMDGKYFDHCDKLNCIESERKDKTAVKFVEVKSC